MNKKISFDVDWDALFPGKEFVVSNKAHIVTPLDIEGISNISRKIKAVLPMIQAEGINWENINHPNNIVKIIPILMDNAPDIVSEATGIELNSLVKFPPSYLLEIITIVIEINLESKESLEKNLKSLIKTFQSLQKEDQEMES